MAPPTTNWYQTIGVPGDADDHAIERAHRRLQLRIHPDKQPKDAPNLPMYTEYSAHVNDAKDNLLDCSQRSELDHLLRLDRALPHYSQPNGQKRNIPFTKPASWPATKPPIRVASDSKDHQAQGGEGGEGGEGQGKEYFFSTQFNTKRARSDCEDNVGNEKHATNSKKTKTEHPPTNTSPSNVINQSSDGDEVTPSTN